ncbi:aspartyl/glutamyl-tRNA(Asn/Gln) amidotransferase subunit B [Arenicella chitinivorans]|uniref:Aspartyl/glutamyl-tRNA(Asn/Gln) amidotransferase subunit B n=1 Tax=Arenicella chitinivorans TaxID=1329800 RepID=A0A918RXC9_9GAMM|nr:Asp-tRNA(Asn)/Glu-tRNA(Gln) amidotransferase subunit GatB [Arenicella chitinivorans]GHA16102.1 aspartyl/glutamyl-tRNA(Asn/Gln) amidotransferase subunit B [Arenicella chitinivorans]
MFTWDKHWEVVIGLEVHTQLLTKSKIFSGSSIAYGAEPNTQASAVDIALPGVLPVMNREAARLAVKFGLAIGAHINQRSVFARKNYFYPDLPKGYQISQMELPIVGLGQLEIETEQGSKVIGITRAHLEEDAGKSLHEDFQGQTGIDLNRAGTPLLEIVSEPDMRSPAEAVAYLRKLHSLVRYIEICDGNMQEGSFRCDANVSVRPVGQTELGTRTELKNINSFRFVERAIEFEIERQIDILEDGGQVVQETRLYDPDNHETRSMRSKEDAHDYRYFPDPDLPPMVLDDAFLEEVRATLPELPAAKHARFVADYQLSDADALLLTADRSTADFFEQVATATRADSKTVANWMAGELFANLNKSELDIADSPISAAQMATLLDRLQDNTLSGKTAKQVFAALWAQEGDVDQIIESNGLKQITDTGAIEAIVDEVIASCPDQVQQFKDGNDKVIGFLVGQVMQKSRGKANPQMANQMLQEKMKS